MAACGTLEQQPLPTATRILPSPMIQEISIPATVLPSVTPPIFPTETPQEAVPATPIPPTEVAENVVIPPGSNAQVSEGRGNLRLRSAPQRGDNVLVLLDDLTPLEIVGRTSDNVWLQVIIPDGRSGWVMAQFVDVWIDLGTVGNVIEPPPEPAVGFTSSEAISGVSSTARDIFLRGQERGNRANVFSKVGDSLTVATYAFFPVGWGQYNLRGYGNLQAVVNYFSAATARDGNSFANTSLAADNGWTTYDVLDPARANPGICQPGESPLVCEYRVVRPALALILFGTNDVSGLSNSEYRANLTRIVEISKDMGVIPVLSTVPPRVYFDGQVDAFNDIVWEVGRVQGVPVWDYGGLMRDLPNRGLSEDGVHPSFPPGDYTAAADLTPENLQYGYTLRNLTALQVLDSLWRQVLY